MSRFLDRAGAADRAAIKAHAQQAQYDEYDDEYDDSYDDLGGPSADGVADVEGVLSCHAKSLHLAAPGCNSACLYMPTLHQRHRFSCCCDFGSEGQSVNC